VPRVSTTIDVAAEPVLSQVSNAPALCAAGFRPAPSFRFVAEHDQSIGSGIDEIKEEVSFGLLTSACTNGKGDGWPVSQSK